VFGYVEETEGARPRGGHHGLLGAQPGWNKQRGEISTVRRELFVVTISYNNPFIYILRIILNFDNLFIVPYT
jgi:hypothetical protein